MSHSTLNRSVAACVFLAAAATYLITLSPTVVFWDVGEFIAAAKLLQVPHPPGSPLFLLAARIAMMIPFAADQAVRAHALSAVLSAGAILFFYLVIVRVLVGYRGIPATTGDRILVYGAGAIGALSLAFGTTYWDNSIEAEVYGASMFFLSLILWLTMRWSERAETKGNERYILVVAYLLGLSLGVHLLSLLAIFPVLMIIYFRKYPFSVSTAWKFLAIAVGIFFVVYPGIVKFLPGMMDGDFGGMKGQWVTTIPWIILTAVAYGVFTSYKKKQHNLHIALLSILLVFLGYTTYTSVLIRSNAKPPMNENAPDNLARLTSYLGREQYGNAPLFMPRRYSNEPHQQGIYTNYSSDMDFLVRYQLNHMFFRYVGWNYVGEASDQQDTGVDWHQSWGIPLLLGLFGLYHQFRCDWKMGLVFASMFIIMGPVLALYQNQQEPQPRERDYFYVGAYYVFSLWIAVGVVGLIDRVREWLTNDRLLTAASTAVVVLAAIAVPANLMRMNWHEHDRSGDYVAWDYSYNLLQTCDKDAILFTNGDNDTFPLWYLQDVEGVRRDVRVICLSLANTNWYIQQLKDKPYYAEAQAVPISFSDARIAGITPIPWETKRVDLPVTPDALNRYGADDTTVVRTGKITFLHRNSISIGGVKALRTQDLLVRDVIFTNAWKRPIFFASTCTGDAKIGLDEYLWFHGLAFRLEPRHIHRDDLGINAKVLSENIFNEPEGFSRTPQYGYKFRRVGDPHIFFDENASRMMYNYRTAFLRLASYHDNIDHDTTAAIATLNRMDMILPRDKFPMGIDISSYVCSLYHRLGMTEKFNAIAAEIEPQARKMIESGKTPSSGYDNPYRVLLELYDLQQEYGKSIDLLKQIQVQYPNDEGLRQRIAQTEELLKNKGK